ncbi:SDR family oxidoreductase [Akkermansiaceae bacterium]|nr:SDR family oxidoreductase [Akkermansiaceae bacterium]
MMTDLAQKGLNPRTLDVTSLEDWERVFAEILSEHEGLDYFFNNAGITLLAESSTLTPDHWRKILDVNVNGVTHSLTTIYPHMVKRGQGHILNTASLAAVTGYATAAPYTCSKGYLLGLHKSLAPEANHKGVDFSLICPGYVNTQIFREGRVLHDNPDEVLESAPLKAITPDQAAEFILKGLLKKKRLIIFPFTTKVLWWLAHWFPPAMVPFQKKLLAPFRAPKS